jgi:hypothetical protein
MVGIFLHILMSYHLFIVQCLFMERLFCFILFYFNKIPYKVL